MAEMVKNLPAVQEMQVRSLGQEDPPEEGSQPTSIVLSGESHGQRSLVACSPWGHKASDTPEATEHTHTHAHMSPFQNHNTHISTTETGTESSLRGSLGGLVSPRCDIKALSRGYSSLGIYVTTLICKLLFNRCVVINVVDCFAGFFF